MHLSLFKQSMKISTTRAPTFATNESSKIMEYWKIVVDNRPVTTFDLFNKGNYSLCALQAVSMTKSKIDNTTEVAFVLLAELL